MHNGDELFFKGDFPNFDVTVIKKL